MRSCPKIAEKKARGNSQASKCKSKCIQGSNISELLLIDHGGKLMLVDCGCSKSIQYVTEEELRLLQRSPYKIELVDVKTVTGNHPFVRIHEPRDILGTTLDSITYSSKGQIRLKSGRPIDLLLGMDFINSLGGLSYYLDEEGRQVLEFPKGRFKVVNSVVFDRDSLKNLQSSSDLGLDDFEHFGLAAIFAYDEPKEPTIPEPLRHRLSAEDLLLMRHGYSDREIKAFPSGSKVLKVIEINEGKIYKIQLPSRMGKVDRRYVFHCKWLDGNEPRNHIGPAGFGFEKLNSELKEKAGNEWTSMTDNNFMLPTALRSLKLTIPLLAVPQLHKTTPVRIVGAASELNERLTLDVAADHNLFKPVSAPDFIRRMRGSKAGKRRRRVADIRKAFMKIWVTEYLSRFQGFRMPLEGGAVYRCPRLLWGTKMAPKILGVVIQDILAGDGTSQEPDLRPFVDAYFDDLFFDEIREEDILERLARYDCETKEPTDILDSAVLGLRLKNGRFFRRAEVPVMQPEPETGVVSYSSLASWLGKLVAHSPIGNSLRVEAALLLRLSGLGPKVDRKLPLPEPIKRLADLVYNQAMLDDRLTGVWQYDTDGKWVLYSDASKRALGAVLTIDGVVVEDASRLRKKGCKMHINIAELQGVLEALKLVRRQILALGINRRLTVSLKIDNVSVASWLLKDDPNAVACMSRKMVISRLEKIRCLVKELNLDLTVAWLGSGANLADKLTRVSDELTYAFDKLEKERAESVQATEKPRRAVVVPRSSLAPTESSPEEQRFKEVLAQAGDEGVGFGSFKEDQEFFSLGSGRQAIQTALAAIVEQSNPSRDESGKVIFHSLEEIKSLIRHLHARDHPGKGELGKRVRYLVSPRSPAVSGTGKPLRKLVAEFACLDCMEAKQHFDSKRCREGQGERETEVPNRLIYPAGLFPWEQVHMDIMGPWYGDLYVVVAVDYFSKFAVIETMKGAPTSEACMRVLHFIEWAYLSFPRRVVVDQGRQFISANFKDFVSSLGAELRHTGTAAHWQNGVVERLIKDLGDRLTASVSSWKRQYPDSEATPEVVSALMYRIVSEHNHWSRASSQQSPASLVLAYPTWVDKEILRYRPRVEQPIQEDLDLKVAKDTQEIAEGPKEGELWKVPVLTRKKGEKRHVVVRVVKFADETGMVYAKFPGSMHAKRLVQHQFLEKLRTEVANAPGVTGSESTTPPNSHAEFEMERVNSLSAESANGAEREGSNGQTEISVSSNQMSKPPSTKFSVNAETQQAITPLTGAGGNPDSDLPAVEHGGSDPTGSQPLRRISLLERGRKLSRSDSRSRSPQLYPRKRVRTHD